jgi:hypothetical protein
MGVAGWALVVAVAAATAGVVTAFYAPRALEQARRSADATADYADATRATYRNDIEPGFRVTISIGASPEHVASLNVTHTGPRPLESMSVELLPGEGRPTWLTGFVNGTDRHEEPTLRRPPAEYPLPLSVNPPPNADRGSLSVRITTVCQGEKFEFSERVAVPKPPPSRGSSPLGR